jgi:two-component system nitrate/nitrite response regulator NarL
VHILIATDATWLVDDIVAALGTDDTTFTVCRDGRAVAGQVAERKPDLCILDLQVGSMGGMAVTMSLRLDESAGTLPRVPILMLLDRAADLHLARRSAADGWLIKPIDSLRLKRAADMVAAGGTYTEGLGSDAAAVQPMVDLGDSEPPITDETAVPASSPEGDPVNAG